MEVFGSFLIIFLTLSTISKIRIDSPPLPPFRPTFPVSQNGLTDRFAFTRNNL
jgi:hypothetical protein